MKWKLPKTYHDFMAAYKEILWPTKVVVEKKKEEVKIPNAEE